MQFVPATARRYGLRNPHNPREAIDAAARYVRDLLRRFGGRADLVLAAYNAGEGTVEAYRDGKRLVLRDGKVVNPSAIRTGGIPPYGETHSYVARGRLVYENITRHELLTVPPKSLGFGPLLNFKDNRVEDSIYVSNFGSRAHTIATHNKRSKSSEDSRRQSLYSN